MQSILLVDPKGADASRLASALEVDGFHVVVASSAGAARAEVEQTPLDLAIVDVMVRGEGATSGLQVARNIKASCPEMPVLLSSNYYLSERQLERVDCPTCGLITKPYDLAQVVSLIHAKLERAHLTRRLWNAERRTALV